MAEEISGFEEPESNVPSYIPGILHKTIAAVCPISGVAIGDITDKSTWSFIPTSAATPEEIAAGKQVITDFDPDDYVQLSEGQISDLLDALLAIESFLVADPGMQAMMERFISWQNWPALQQYLLLQVSMERITDQMRKDFLAVLKEHGVPISE